MYADRLEERSKRPIHERLSGGSTRSNNGGRPLTGKRQRQSDAWKHDLYADGTCIPNGKFGVPDLRTVLQNRCTSQSSDRIKRPLSSTRDLREKLSGTLSLPLAHAEPLRSRLDGPKLSRKTLPTDPPEPEIKEVANISPRKKLKAKAHACLDGFLQSLGLEKYHITFQVEEVDMAALRHMTDEDLKCLGIPMGPRKKILQALKPKG